MSRFQRFLCSSGWIFFTEREKVCRTKRNVLFAVNWFAVENPPQPELHRKTYPRQIVAHP